MEVACTSQIGRCPSTARLPSHLSCKEYTACLVVEWHLSSGMESLQLGSEGAWRTVSSDEFRGVRWWCFYALRQVRHDDGRLPSAWQTKRNIPHRIMTLTKDADSVWTAVESVHPISVALALRPSPISLHMCKTTPSSFKRRWPNRLGLVEKHKRDCVVHQLCPHGHLPLGACWFQCCCYTDFVTVLWRL